MRSLRKSRFFSPILCLLAALLIEILICNVRSFELIGAPAKNVPLTLTAVENAPEGEWIYQSSPEQSFPADLRTVSLQFAEPVDHILTGSIHLEEGGLLAGNTRPFEIIPGVAHSQSIFLYPSKLVTRLTLTFESEPPAILQATLNQPLPVRVHWLRLCALLLLLLLVRGLCHGAGWYSVPFDLARPKQKLGLAVLLLAQILWLGFSLVSTYPNLPKAIQQGNLREEGFIFKEHYQLLTEALLQRSPALLETPPERLAQAENPYDPSQRISQFPPYLWDATYFNGRYYVYFGIVPALTFYIPYVLLFHRYPLNDLAVLFFAMLGSMGLLALYTRLVKKYFRQVPAGLYFVGAAMLLNAAFLAWFVRRSFAYELALVSAFCFVVCGLAFNLSAVREKGLSLWRLFVGCLLIAGAVGCRPTAILASLLNLPILIPALFPKEATGRIRVHWKVLMTAAVPYLLVGAGLMAYNQARFDSVTEFGRTYQLSIQESGVYMNGLPLAAFLIGIVNYIFGAGVSLTSAFPFLKPLAPLTFDFWGIKEFYPIFSAVAVVPLSLSLLFAPFFRSRIRQKGKGFGGFLWLLIGLSLFIAGLTGHAVGTIQRYLLDFSWMLALATLLFTFSLYESLQSEAARKAFFVVFGICFFFGLMVQLPLSLGESYSGRSWFELMNPILFKQIAWAFAFWL